MKSHTTSHKVATSSRKTKIYKRSTHGGWTYKTMKEGKVRYFPLGLDKKSALDLADTIRAKLMIEPFSEVQKQFQKKSFQKIKDPVPTVGQFWDTYKDNAIANGLARSSIRDYDCAFKSVFRKVLGTKKVDDVPVDRLNFQFWMEYKRIKLKPLSDQGEIASCQRTINSKLTKIKALMKQPRIYEGFDLSWYDEIEELEKFSGLKQKYRLPSTDLIQKTFKLWENSSGDLNILLGLILHFGLRRNEAFHARSDWFDMTTDIARVSIVRELDFKPKGGHEGYTQGSKTIAAGILNKAKSGTYLISNRADYGRAVFEPAVEALRLIGWDRNLPLHECRKLFGSYISTTKSIYTSQKFLRHSSVETTNESYSDLITDPKILRLWAA